MPVDRARPSADELHAVAAFVERGARAVSCRRLAGGITTAVHHVTVEGRGGRRHQLVVRRVPWTERQWARAEVTQTARFLTAVAGHGIPVPTVVGVAEDGLVEDGWPALVMEKAAGRVHLAPDDMADWLAHTVRMAAAIHDLPVEADPFTPWRTPDAMSVPESAPRPAVWKAAIAVLRAGEPTVEHHFIHRDYQHYNLLWKRGRISAVVDWGGASRGPTAVDVGHCRLNLAVLFGPAVADDFLARYQAETATAVDPWWDLSELLQYDDDWMRFIPVQVAGRAPLDVAGMTKRVEDTVASAVSRVG